MSTSTSETLTRYKYYAVVLPTLVCFHIESLHFTLLVSIGIKMYSDCNLTFSGFAPLLWLGHVVERLCS